MKLIDVRCTGWDVVRRACAARPRLPALARWRGTRGGLRLVLLVHVRHVGADHVVRQRVLAHEALVDPDRALAERLDGAEVVRHEHQRLAGVAELEHAVDAASLEALVADRQHLVDQQHVGVDVDRDREAEPREHAARVRLDGVVGEALELGEGDDVVDPRLRSSLRGMP